MYSMTVSLSSCTKGLSSMQKVIEIVSCMVVRGTHNLEAACLCIAHNFGSGKGTHSSRTQGQLTL